MGQMSFFSADAHPRALTDLEGVLCSRGQLSVFGRGTTARLSIVLGAPPVVPVDSEPEDDVARRTDAENDPDARPEIVEHEVVPSAPEPDDSDPQGPDPEDDPEPDDAGPDDSDHLDDLDDLDHLDEAAEPDGAAESVEPVEPALEHAVDPVAEWRAHALCCAFRTRGVDAEVDRLDDGRPVVRSAYRADLVPLARAWTRGAIKALPADFDLDGPRLRLWVLAAGRRHGPAYLLGLDPHSPGAHRSLLAASTRAGLGATLGGDRAEPVLRIVGRRRQARLAELIGGRPRSLVDGIWPG